VISRADFLKFLDANGSQQLELFEESRKARSLEFGETAVLRGVVEASNVCRVDCEYCPMRRSNFSVDGAYELDSVSLVEGAAAIASAGLDVILIQAGESVRVAKSILASMKNIMDQFATPVEVLLNLGVLGNDLLEDFRIAGATSYILKHETSDAELHRKIRHEELERRIDMVKRLKDHGYRVGMGMIAGLPGQRAESLYDDVKLAVELEADMCSVSPFIPAQGTPLAGEVPGDTNRALNLIALMRLMQPSWLIPSVSALEAISPGAQRRGFEAGANVMTVNFTPMDRQKEYLIYGDQRHVVTMNNAERILASAALMRRGSVFI
jgi:biotin synthase